MNTTTTALGYRLRQLRLSRNLSQRDLEDRLDLNHSYISHLENGTSGYPPSEHLIEQMAQFFEVDTEELIFLAGKIPSAYSGLLSSLAVKYGQSLPSLLKELLESDRDETKCRSESH